MLREAAEGAAKETAEEKRREDRSGCEQKQDQVSKYNSDSYLNHLWSLGDQSSVQERSALLLKCLCAT